MKKRLLIFFLLTIESIIAQNSIVDSVNFEKILLFKNINNDSLIHYSLKAQKSTNFCLIYRAKTCEAKGYYQKGNYQIAEKISLNVLNQLKQKNSFCQKQNKIIALNRLFWIKKNQSKFQIAHNYLIERKKIIESFEIKDDYYLRQLISVNTDIARIKMRLGLFDEAKKEFAKINNTIKTISFDSSSYSKYQEVLLQKTSILNSLGDSYLQLGIKNNSLFFLDSSMVSYTRSYEISKSLTPLHEDSEPLYYLRISKVDIAKKKFENALFSINKSNQKKFIQSISFLKSICFSNIDEIDSTAYYSYKYLKSSQTFAHHKKNLITTYNILANHYSRLSEIDSAYKYSELTLKEYHNLDEVKKNTLNTLYNNDIDEIKKLNQSILKKEGSLRKRFTIFIYSASFLFFLLIYFSYKNRNLLKNKLEIVSNNILPKKKYNIDKSFETKILTDIKEMEGSLSYLKSDFTIHSLAKDLNTNTSYLSAIINKNKQQTFKQYITGLRIKHLQKILQEDKKFRNYTIQALGEEIGYTNASAFARAFKKYTNVTPTEYVKSLDKL